MQHVNVTLTQERSRLNRKGRSIVATQLFLRGMEKRGIAMVLGVKEERIHSLLGNGCGMLRLFDTCHFLGECPEKVLIECIKSGVGIVFVEQLEVMKMNLASQDKLFTTTNYHDASAK